MKKTNLFIITVICLFLLCSCNKTHKGFTYENNETGITVTGYSGEETSIIIPEKINGKAVTEIGQSAFDESVASSIVIPNTVEIINDYAFRRNAKLESIEIPDSVKKIGKGAFNFCSSLTSVSFGKNVAEIGDNAFAVTYIQSAILPDATKTIGDYTFYDCKLLEKIVLPKVETIGNSAFSGCLILSDVTLNPDLTGIGDYCFMNCCSLKNIDLGNKITTLPMGVFAGTGFTEYRVSSYIKEIGRNAFSSCQSLTDIYIPSSVEKIDETALPDNRNLIIHGPTDGQGEIFADYHGYKFTAD